MSYERLSHVSARGTLPSRDSLGCVAAVALTALPLSLFGAFCAGHIEPSVLPAGAPRVATQRPLVQIQWSGMCEPVSPDYGWRQLNNIFISPAGISYEQEGLVACKNGDWP